MATIWHLHRDLPDIPLHARVKLMQALMVNSQNQLMTYELLTKNPCIDICEFNKKKVCKACGRTREEKKDWKNLSREDKHQVWLRSLETHARGDKKKARKLRARYEKVRHSANRHNAAEQSADTVSQE